MFSDPQFGQRIAGNGFLFSATPLLLQESRSVAGMVTWDQKSSYQCVLQSNDG